MMDSNKTSWVVTAALGGLCAVMGCSRGTAEDGRNALGSQTMVTSADYRALYVASADDDIVAKVDLTTGSVVAQPVAGEPTKVARLGDRILVTQRASRSVIELLDDGLALTVGRSVVVGAEPVGIVASEDATRVYVAVSMAGQVLELDGTTLDTLRAWDVAGEPTWLALHPSRQSLYVAGTQNATFVHIDLESGATTNITLPRPMGIERDTGVHFELTPRITGDPAASPNGRFVAVPMVYVNNTTPLVDTRDKPGELPPDEGGYSNRVTPAVTMVPVDSTGVVETDGITIIGVSGPSYPASATFTPNSKYVGLSIEGGGVVVIVQAEPDGADAPGPPGLLGLVHSPAIVIGTSEGPRAIAFVDDDTGHAYSFIDRTTTSFDVVWNDLGDNSEPVFFDSFGDPNAQHINGAVGYLITKSKLEASVESGRRMFYAANDARVSGLNAGISCATCHFQGRVDGLTWNFERGPRQTPSLAGMVSLREPVRWDGSESTVAEDALATSQGLMGGRGLLLGDAQLIAAFVDFTRSVDLPMKGAADERIARGEAIFNRADIACSTCHAGPLYTDKARYDMLGFTGVKTPSLVGVAATPPYFHDGTAATLRDVLEYARGGAMGNTSSLSEVEMEELEMFLRSL